SEDAAERVDGSPRRPRGDQRHRMRRVVARGFFGLRGLMRGERKERSGDSGAANESAHEFRLSRLKSVATVSVMPGLVPGIHVFECFIKQDVDGRDKPGHDNPYGTMRRTRSGVISAMLRTPSSAMSRCTSSCNRPSARCTPSSPATTAAY